MLESIIVGLIVAVAAYIAIKKVAVQLQGKGCSGGNCSCQSGARPTEETANRKS